MSLWQCSNSSIGLFWKAAPTFCLYPPFPFPQQQPFQYLLVFSSKLKSHSYIAVLFLFECEVLSSNIPLWTVFPQHTPQAHRPPKLCRNTCSALPCRVSGLCESSLFVCLVYHILITNSTSNAWSVAGISYGKFQTNRYFMNSASLKNSFLKTSCLFWSDWVTSILISLLCHPLLFLELFPLLLVSHVFFFLDLLPHFGGTDL